MKGRFYTTVLAMAAALHAVAQTLPAGFTATTVLNNLAWPTRMAFAPDGRLFILEQAGSIRILKNGQLLSAPFATVTTETAMVSNTEEGLLGLAIDPDFAANGYVYVYYTVMSPMHQRISRFRANPPSADVADLAEGEVALLDVERGTCHCGGALEFGPDGKLYAGIGDSYTGTNSQSLTTLKGKIIRMNPVTDSNAQAPADNPFYATATGRYRLIWALGLRNPYSMAFQPGTGRLFINDVGLSAYEEINDGAAGRNFGWPATEGPFDPFQYPQYELPVLAYQRTGPGPTLGGLIVSGAFYNPSTVQFPAAYVGKYFFSDYSWNGWIRQLNTADSTTANFSPPRSGSSNYLDVKVAPDGSLYYLIRAATGSLVRVSYNNSNSLRENTNRALDFSLDRATVSGNRVRLRYTVSGNVTVHLAAYDPSGRPAATLVDAEVTPGSRMAEWDASSFPAGVYTFRLKSQGSTLTRQLALIR